ncbi:hypothetical protein NXS19_009971 [Fusarium pseudograminearum]|nr:hypothetical protein NXS19_009971 [Fusarium pseudograminearum]
MWRSQIYCTCAASADEILTIGSCLFLPEGYKQQTLQSAGQRLPLTSSQDKSYVPFISSPAHTYCTYLTQYPPGANLQGKDVRMPGFVSGSLGKDRTGCAEVFVY